MKGREYSYIAYIDEAGDDGIRRIKPIDDPGSSEWLILSAVVVSASREDELKDWMADIRGRLRNLQARSIHFSRLSSSKKEIVCEALSSLPARYFVVCSNKKNMRGYRNPFAEQIPSQCWFYCWLSRILLERVTDFVNWRSHKDHGEPRKLRIEYSKRGGLSYGQMKAYYRWLDIRSSADRHFLPLGDLKWPVVDYELIRDYPHYERSGLQIADVVASAFFKACDKYDTGSCDPSYAKLLSPRMARFRDKPFGRISGYGVKLMPNWKRIVLDDDQKEIFSHFGYPKEWWDPDPSNPVAVRPAT